jgi:hypothetical protein
MARAQAEEIRRHPATFDVWAEEEPMKGIEWLKAAQEVASSDLVKAHVAREIATRLGKYEEFSNSRQWLDNASVGSEAAQAKIGQAKADLDALEEQVLAGYQARAKEAHQMRIAHFTDQLQRAQANGSRRIEQYARQLAELKSQAMP